MSEPITDATTPAAEAPPLTSFAVVTFFLLLPLVAIWAFVSPDTLWLPWLGLAWMMFHYRPRTVAWLRWLMAPLAWGCVIVTGLCIGLAVGRWVNDVPSEAELAEREKLVEEAQVNLALMRASVVVSDGRIGIGKESAVLANEAIAELEQEAPADPRTAALRAEWAKVGPVLIAVGDVYDTTRVITDVFSTPDEVQLRQVMAKAVAAVSSLPEEHGVDTALVLSELRQVEALRDEFIRTRNAMVANCGSPPRGEGPFKRYMQRVANDPASIEIQSCTTPGGTEETCWMVTCAVRGKNAFGALVLSEQSFLVRHGEVMSLD